MQARELSVDVMTRESGGRGVEAKRETAQRDLDGTVGTRTLTESQREQAAWWGVDVDRPADRASTEPSSGADVASAQETEAVRSPEVAARIAKDSKATRIAADAAAQRQRTASLGQER